MRDMPTSPRRRTTRRHEADPVIEETTSFNQTEIKTMKRTLTIAALVLLASGSAAFAAAPDVAAQAVCVCCDAIAACCEACTCC